MQRAINFYEILFKQKVAEKMKEISLSKINQFAAIWIVQKLMKNVYLII
jgi:hypothetical protein